MITIDSSPAQHFGHGAVNTLAMTGGRLAWKRQSWNELRLFVCESRLARVALTIIFAVAVFAGLQMLGVFEPFASWSVLRNVSGWVGPAAAVGAAGAAAAGAAVGAAGAGTGASSRASGSGNSSQSGNADSPRHQEPPGGYTNFQDDGSYTVHSPDPHSFSGFQSTGYVPGPPAADHWWNLHPVAYDGPTAGMVRAEIENENTVDTLPRTTHTH